MRRPISLLLSLFAATLMHGSIAALPTGADELTDEEEDIIKGTALIKPSIPPKTKAEKDVDFGPYMEGLQNRVKGAWDPPYSEKSMRVVTHFKIDRSGKVTDLKLKSSSGNQLADQAALAAVQWGSPLRELPPGSPQSVDVDFSFDYNVFGIATGKRRAPYSYSHEREQHIRGLQYVRAGRQAFFLKQYDRAVERFKEAEKYLRPSSKSFLVSFMADAIGDKGKAVAATDPEKAAVFYRQALYLDPDADYIARRLEQILVKNGVTTASYRAREALGDEFAKKKEFESAIVEYRCARGLIKSAEKSTAKHEALAVLREDGGRLDSKVVKAVNNMRIRGDEVKWRAFLAQSPGSVEAHLALASVLERLGEIEEAKKTIESGLKVVPGNSQLEEDLKRLKSAPVVLSDADKPPEPSIRKKNLNSFLESSLSTAPGAIAKPSVDAKGSTVTKEEKPDHKEPGTDSKNFH